MDNLHENAVIEGTLTTKMDTYQSLTGKEMQKRGPVLEKDEVQEPSNGVIACENPEYHELDKAKPRFIEKLEEFWFM